MLHNLQFVQVLSTSSFKSTFLVALLNNPSDSKFLMHGCNLLQMVGPRYLSECFPNVTVSNLGTVNSLTLKLCTQLLSLKKSPMYLGHKLFFTLYIRLDRSFNLLFINDGSLALIRSWSYDEFLSQNTALKPLSCTRSSFRESLALQKCHIVWQICSVW